jgi:uncharacterized membrane protein
MDIYLIVLRIVHIFAGVLWVGSAIFFLFLVSPTIKALGAGGQQFMMHFVTRKRYPQYMGAVATLTIVSGILLFANISGGLQIGWLTTGPGVTLAVGSLIGILVMPVGMFGIGPRAQRLGVLGQSIVAAGGPPSAIQAAEIDKLDRELTTYERLDFVMLTISLLTMAVARYMVF